jgi:hypothetical protein
MTDHFPIQHSARASMTNKHLAAASNGYLTAAGSRRTIPGLSQGCSA